MRHISNQDIAKILTEMAALYEMKDEPFKPRAYEKAALSVAALSEELQDLYEQKGEAALKEIPGVGQHIAGHIKELIIKGSFKEYERLKKTLPVDIGELISIEGVGPKTVKVLWQKLKVKTVDDLEEAARAGRIRKLAHFGQRSEKKILAAIEFLRQSGKRFVLGFVEPEIKKLEAVIKNFPEVNKAIVAGSYRRRKETIGDIDVLVTSKKPQQTMQRIVKLPAVGHVYGSGPTKTNVRLKSGIDMDVRVVPEKSWGAALNYFTGSKDHNVGLRTIAVKRGWKLSEYGLFRGKKYLAGRTEEELYKKLGMAYVEPELRENTGEIEAAKKGRLPKLIGYEDLKGDLQVQTNWTDGKNSMEEMALAAERAGLAYIAITDHTRSLAMAGGADEKKLIRQTKEIDELNRKLAKQGRHIRVLKGAEVNIGPEGQLDIEDSVLAQLEVVGAAVHSHFGLPIKTQTKRIIRAMENPNVDIIFHLTTRLINRRKPIELDLEEIIKAAKRTGTVLEIDAFPDRLDIGDGIVRKCVAAGVKMSIDSDAHSAEHFKMLKYGVAQARRGWAGKGLIVNSYPLSQFFKQLKGGR